jgi:hypothetical protein
MGAHDAHHRQRDRFGGVAAQDFAELHWYEAHGIGKQELKIKRYLDQP